MSTQPPSMHRAMWALLGSNLLALTVGWWLDWSLFDLLWPYYLQNLVIGWYASQRIRALQQFRTDGFTINGKALEPTLESRDRVARLLLFHYGVFHAGYLVFLLGLTHLVAAQPATEGVQASSLRLPDMADYLMYLLLGGAFWFGQRQAHAEQRLLDRGYQPNLGTLSFLPYLRVLPMHLMLIFGAVLGGTGMLLFGVLKTAADLATVVVERRIVMRAPAAI